MELSFDELISFVLERFDTDTGIETAVNLDNLCLLFDKLGDYLEEV